MKWNPSAIYNWFDPSGQHHLHGYTPNGLAGPCRRLHILPKTPPVSSSPQQTVTNPHFHGNDLAFGMSIRTKTGVLIFNNGKLDQIFSKFVFSWLIKIVG